MRPNHLILPLLALLGALSLAACAPPSDQVGFVPDTDPPRLGFAGFTRHAPF